MVLNEKLFSDLYDVILIGAGISGINAAYRIQTEVPSTTYTILEARAAIGGTWSLFNYPGFRSDSDLDTFGFPWRPWDGEKTIADGESICKYIRQSAEDYGIDDNIKFQHKLTSANWSSDQQAWALDVDNEGEHKVFHARFIIFSTGYYDYDEALSSAIPGIENFTGTTVHPQFWPTDFDYQNKKIVVIGSGSTAVTLLPALSEKASHVTMLQRSPSYIVARPAIDPFSQRVRNFFPSWLAYRISRFKFLIFNFYFVRWCARNPLKARNLLKKATLKQLPDGIPYDPHFLPRYNPWEQRLCLCPNGDFYKALRAGKADVVTDTITTVTETGIELASGSKIDADVIVTATGLKIKTAGGARISVDGVPVNIGEKFLWKGTMLQDVPNAALVLGYTTASWTLGADIAAKLVCRLLKLMSKRSFTAATPRLEDQSMKSVPALNLTSTYVVRGAGELPKTGDKAPWGPKKTYFSDLWDAWFRSLTEGLELVKIST